MSKLDRTWLAALAACVACSGGNGTNDAGVDADDGYREIGLYSVVPNPDVDLLFVIDDSASTNDIQQNVKNNFKTLVDVLSTADGGLPNLHLGVVSQDMGTLGVEDSLPGPAIPGCMNSGKGGALQTNGSSLVTGNFIEDIRGTGGARMTNHAGTLPDAFASIATLGSQGCGFEQPLHAAKAALESNPANAGFLRADANLVVVVLMDEDDCSYVHSSFVGSDPGLGPLQSFRCTHFGITCDQGGKTPDEMNMFGDKSGCHSNESGMYLSRIADFATFFKGVKTDPRRFALAAIVGDPAPVVIEPRAPQVGSTPVPALSHSCSYQGADGPGVADPAVRIVELANQLDRHVVGTVCRQDQSQTLAKIGTTILQMTGDLCVNENIKLPADCQLFDVEGAAERGPIPVCGVGPGGNDCFEIVEDQARCPRGQHLRIEAGLASQPKPDRYLRLRCKL